MYKEFKALKNSSGHGVSFGANELYLGLRVDTCNAKASWDLEPEEVKLLVKELLSWLDYQDSQSDIQQPKDQKDAEHLCDHAIELDIRSLERHQKLEREVEQVEDKLADTNDNLTTLSDHYASVLRVALDRFDEICARLDRLEDYVFCEKDEDDGLL